MALQWGHVCPSPCQHSRYSAPQLPGSLRDVKQYLTIVLIRISLITSEFERLFLCSLVTRISSANCQFIPLAHFSTGAAVFLSLLCRHSLYITDRKSLLLRNHKHHHPPICHFVHGSFIEPKSLIPAGYFSGN